MLSIDEIYDQLEDINSAALQDAADNAAHVVSTQQATGAADSLEFDPQAYKQKLLSKLNDRQAEAVSMPKTSGLVLAGAGSGKTSVLTARVAYLVADKVAPSQIMTVTFTNKAAQEMRLRLRRILPRDVSDDIWMGTFHSLCNKILRECHEAAGLPKNFAILDTDGQEALVKSLMRDAGLLPTKAERDQAAALRAAERQSILGEQLSEDPLAQVATSASVAGDEDDDEAEDRRMKPSEVVSWINRHKEINTKPTEIEPKSVEEQTKLQMYEAYQQACADQGLLDFSDLLHRCVDLLECDSTVRNSYRDKFKAILVDEFQDTNDVQYRWLQLLKAPSSYIMAVGDDDQSIYAFRGANPANMHRFVSEMTATDEHPEGFVVKLEQNYRSLPYILDAANAVIDRNSNRMGKTLWSGQPDGKETIVATQFENGYQEANAVAARIHDLVRNKGVPPNEVAVLYRTNTQSRLLEQELNKLSIPVTVYGGFRFFERQEVKNVLAYMDLACSFERDISLSRVVNFPPRGIGERTIEDLRQEAKANNVSMMKMIAMREESGEVKGAAAQHKQAQLVGFATTMLELTMMAQSTTLSELVGAIVEKMGIRQFYLDGGEASGKKKSKAGKGEGARNEAEERLANIDELIAAARQFEQDNPHLATAAEMLPEYLSFVQLMTSTSAADMDKKSTVSLMTVHSSKGLEFDHVYVTGLEEGIFPHGRAIKEDEERAQGASDAYREDAWIDGMAGSSDEFATPNDGITDESTQDDGPAIQEERRLMYVAMTRARKQLEITYAQSRMVGSEEKLMERSRFALEIPKARIEFTTERNPRSAAHDNGAARPSFSLGSAGRSQPGNFSGFKGFGAGRSAPNTGAREYGGDAFDDTREAYVPKATQPVARGVPQKATAGPSSTPQRDAAASGVTAGTPAATAAAQPIANQAKTSWMKRRVVGQAASTAAPANTQRAVPPSQTAPPEVPTTAPASDAKPTVASPMRRRMV